MIQAAGKLGAWLLADPLRSALLAGVVATGGALAWHVVIRDPAQAQALRNAERDRDAIAVEHARQVAAAQFDRAQASEAARKREAALQAENDKLRTEIDDAKKERDERARAAAAARVQLAGAEARFLAELARRAGQDSSAACGTYADAAGLLGQLHGETDGIAEEASRAADAAADQVRGLQAYITRECRAP